MLNTKVKTHYILIKEWDRGNIKKIALTKSEYELYEQEVEMKKHNWFFKMYDIDTNELLFNGRANKVEWFEEIKLDPALMWAVWICSLWTRHALSAGWDCDCSKKFNTLWITFKDEIEKLGYKVKDTSEITEEMQLAYLKLNK